MSVMCTLTRAVRSRMQRQRNSPCWLDLLRAHLLTGPLMVQMQWATFTFPSLQSHTQPQGLNKERMWGFFCLFFKIKIQNGYCLSCAHVGGFNKKGINSPSVLKMIHQVKDFIV